MHAYVFTICLCDYLYRFSVCSVCVGLRSVCLRGLTEELGLNLNAGHCAACRFRFCLPAPLCAQDGNPSHMARIPIKSNNLPPPTAIEARPPRVDRGCTWWSCKASVPTLWCASEGVDLNCFVNSHRDKTDKGTGIIGLMLERVWPSASYLIPLTHSLDSEAGLQFFQCRLIKDWNMVWIKINER